MTNGQIGQTAHGAYIGYCESIGDHSQPSWGELPQDAKDSIINRVENIRKNLDVTPEEIHKNWLAWKKANGWQYKEKVENLIVDGEVEEIKVPLPKNAVRKINPLIVPYEDLAPEHKFKNELFIAVVRVCDPVLKVEVVEEEPDEKTPEVVEPVDETPEEKPEKPEEKTIEDKDPVKTVTSKKKPSAKAPKKKPSNKGSDVHEVQKGLRKP